jgi:hypothetical protein
MLQRPTELLNLALLDLTPIDNRSVRHCQKFAYLETLKKPHICSLITVYKLI